MKRLLWITLILLVTVALLAACGDSETTAATTTDGGAISTSLDVTSSAETTTTTPVTQYESFILNDNPGTYYQEGAQPGTNDTVTFSSHWAQSKGYPTRFVAGDEHWITTSECPTDKTATITIKFIGTAIELYGHTGTTGGMAMITLDGIEKTELCDFYSSSRIEAKNGKYAGTLLPFYTVDGLASGEHEIIVTFLTTEKNSKQSGKPELAFDYARITRVVGSNPTVNSERPTIEAVFEGSIGSPYQYAYADDYLKIYESFAENSPVKTKTLKLFRSDVINSKIDLLIGKTGMALTAKASEFKTSDGKTLPASVFTLSFLDSVLDHETGRRVYDVLGESTKTFSEKTYGVLWIEVATAKDTPAGVYNGKITVSGTGHEISFDYTVEITALDLSAADATLTNELWTYPYSACRYYSGKSTYEYFGTDHTKSNKAPIRNVYLEDKYFPQLAAQLKLYAKAGGDIITATVIDDAWNNQTTDPYPSMVKWSKTADGKWAFDYTDFDKWVELNVQNGVDGEIHCYSLASWNSNNVIIYRDANGQNKSASFATGSAEWREVWTAFLKDFMKHTKEKGWFDITYLSMDERSTEIIKAVCEVVHGVTDENGKSFKMSMAVNRLHSIDYFDNFQNLSISSSQREKLGTLVADRAAKGLTTTFYTCGATAGSLRNEPYETLDFFYFLAKNGTDGYLRWALDAYVAAPLEDTVHHKFVAGDVSLIYPDDLDDENPTVKSSVRYQIIIEAYKNMCALEVISGLSENAEKNVTALLRLYYSYSPQKEKVATNMDEKVYNLAKELLS